MSERPQKEDYSADWLLGKMNEIVPAISLEDSLEHLRFRGRLAHFTIMRQFVVSGDSLSDGGKRAALYEGVLDDFRKLSSYGPPSEMFVRIYPRDRLFDSEAGVKYLRLRIRFSFLYDGKIFEDGPEAAELFARLLDAAKSINSATGSKAVIVTI